MAREGEHGDALSGGQKFKVDEHAHEAAAQARLTLVVTDAARPPALAPLDGRAGVRTVAVAVGAARALRLSLVPLALGALAAATAPALPLTSGAPLLLQMSLALRAARKGFDAPSLAAAIELAPAWLLWALVALTM